MKQVFAPGCALMIYKPHLAQKAADFLNREIGLDNLDKLHLTCCRHTPNLPLPSQVINICAGCDRRYRSLYEGVSTISFWEIVAKSESFRFPNYKRIKMSVHDACPTRTEERVHHAVRCLLQKMNIEVVEPLHTKSGAVCCGDSFYKSLPADEVKSQMKKRAAEMPCEDVAVYCVSCIKSMHIGGKKPRYLMDLLFGEETTPEPFDTDLWHAQLDAYIEKH